MQRMSLVLCCTRGPVRFDVSKRHSRSRVSSEGTSTKVRFSDYKSCVYAKYASLVSRQDLVGWLQQQIAEQKRIDASTSGTVGYPAVVPASFGGKDTSSSGDVQLLLPADTKKHRKQVKQILLDRGTHIICMHRIPFRLIIYLHDSVRARCAVQSCGHQWRADAGDGCAKRGV